MDTDHHGFISHIAVAAAIDDEGFVAAAEEMAENFVPAVEAAGVGAQKPFHPGDEVGQRRFQNEMKMILHQAIRVDLP